ncbi:MAG TPA: hypothetical protein VKD25_09815 [Burkholderiales bacterium]|nr:hypothetical protein [Burkholderiales bacterium]
MKNRVLTGLLAAACVAGCVAGGKQPMSAEEFRKVAPGAFLMKSESYEVNRSLKQVAAAFQKRAPECLSQTIRMTERSATHSLVVVTTYKPTVVVGADRAELHLQRRHDKGVVKVYDEPPDGHYILVVDAYPAGSGRTRIQLIGVSKGHDVVYRAINGWATGDNMGCPDMTKIG